MIYHIVDNIYLSDLKSAENLQYIEDNNIKTVIRLSEDRDNKSIYNDSIFFINIELEDNIFAADAMEDVANNIFYALPKLQSNILIHCNMGQSRSVSVIIYYLIKKYKCTYKNAFEIIKAKKEDINPNRAFEQKLRNVYKKSKDTCQYEYPE